MSLREKINLFLYIFICTMSLISFSSALHFKGRTDICEPIKIPMCQSMPYNMTRMPNLLHHSTQENAVLAIEQFQELLNQNCSDVLLFFLCSLYAPICTVYFQSEPIPPCRSVCEKARAGCEQIVNNHNISWPEFLDCSNLPRYDRGVCVSPEAIVSSPPEVGTFPHYPGTDTEDANSGKPGSKRRNRKGCKCNKKRHRPKRKSYKKGKFDFAIHGRINGQKVANTINTVTSVTVLKVLKYGRVTIKENTNIEIWTNSTCVCPKLSKRREYFIIGYEDIVTNRLLYLDTCLAARWKSKWEKRFKSWNKSGKRRSRRKCKKLKGRKRKKCRRRKKINKTDRPNFRNKNKDNKKEKKNSTSPTSRT